MEIAKDPAVLSVEQVRLRFYASGTSVTDWAREHGFSRQVVYSLLSGRTRGYRGTAHDAAVALGLKVKLDASELDLLGMTLPPAKTRSDQDSTSEERTMTS